MKQEPTTYQPKEIEKRFMKFALIGGILKSMAMKKSKKKQTILLDDAPS